MVSFLGSVDLQISAPVTRPNKREATEISPTQEHLHLSECRRIYFLMLLLKKSIADGEYNRFNPTVQERIKALNPFRIVTIEDNKCCVEVDRAFATYCKCLTVLGVGSSFSIQDTKEERTKDRIWLYPSKIFNPWNYSYIDGGNYAKITFTLPSKLANNLRFKQMPMHEVVESIWQLSSSILKSYIAEGDLDGMMQNGFVVQVFQTKGTSFQNCYDHSLSSHVDAFAPEVVTAEPASSSSSITSNLKSIKRPRTSTSITTPTLKYTHTDVINICHRFHFLSHLFAGILEDAYSVKFMEITWNRLKEKQQQEKLIRLVSLEDNICTVIADIAFILFNKNIAYNGIEGQSAGSSNDVADEEDIWSVADAHPLEQQKFTGWLKKSHALFQPVTCQMTSATDMLIIFKVPPSATSKTLPDLSRLFRSIIESYIHATEFEDIDALGFRGVTELRSNYVPLSICLDPEGLLD